MIGYSGYGYEDYVPPTREEVLEERRLDRERINRWREELEARKQWEALKKQHLDVDFNPWRVIEHPRLGGLARAD
jgi:hypothetical protein